MIQFATHPTHSGTRLPVAPAAQIGADGRLGACPELALEEIGTQIVVKKGAELWAQGERSMYAYRVVSGCIRQVKLMEDGRRHITDFLLSGEWAGLEGRDEHDDAAEAVTDAVLRRFPKRGIAALAVCNLGFLRWQVELMSQKLYLAQERMLTLGRRTAAERVACFLLDMAERAGRDRTGAVILPMSRTDIGDYLGLRLETACRVMARLQREGAIKLLTTGFAIRDRSALDACAHASLD
jgi:CRP/FNR family nitrogen fixation transcriptional regulator